MTFKYRDHRRLLGESMETVQTFDNRADLIAYLAGDLRRYSVTADADTILIDPYCNDERIGWNDCHIVWIKGWGVLGFTDSAPT